MSRYHAEVIPSGDVLELRDLGSRCGTRLDGRPVKRALIRSGAEIGVGPYRLRFDGSSFEARSERGALHLSAEGLVVDAGDARILSDVSLAIEPGELVVVIGESGSGKTTLVRALAGVQRPNKGRVRLNGEPITARLTDVGYVPQEEIVHRLLSVREALGFAARLRLPHDTPAAERSSVIERVLAAVSLEDRADTRIDHLSGGQRKRAAVASELLTRPSVLVLDEPTTGLDPMLERRLMQLFRDLAHPGGQAVVVVTHATRSLELCDKVAVMGGGGGLAFFGSPAEALRFFEVGSYDEIYAALEEGDWRRRPPSTPAPAGDEPGPEPAGSPAARRRPGPQTLTLIDRYVRLLARDRRNLVLLLAQAPLIGLGVALLFRTGLFGQPGLDAKPGRPGDAAQFLFLCVITALWLGSIDSVREIVKERSITVREAAVGVRWGAYVTSKVVVLFTLAALQTLMLAYSVFVFRPLEEPAGTYAGVVSLLVLTSFVAVGLGLLISALVRTQDQATSFLPLILIPQLLFAGAVVPVERMSEPLAALSTAAFSRWGFAGAGNAIDMPERLEADPGVARATGYGGFFELPMGSAAGVLGCFAVGLIAAVLILLWGRRS